MTIRMAIARTPSSAGKWRFEGLAVTSTGAAPSALQLGGALQDVPSTAGMVVILDRRAPASSATLPAPSSGKARQSATIFPDDVENGRPVPTSLRSATNGAQPWRGARAMRYMLMMNVPAGTGDYQIGAWAPEDFKAHIAFMHRYNKELKDAGEFVDGQGLAPPNQAKLVRAGKKGEPITDGPFAESTSMSQN